MMTLRRDDPLEISSTKTIPAETIPAKTTPAKTTPAGGVPTARVRPLVVTRGILWSFRLLHLAPLVALYLLPVGKWPAVIIVALWPLWLIGLFFLEMQLLHRWLGLGLSRAGRAFLRDAEAGDADAQYRLGKLFQRGNAGFSGTEGARDTALNWYRLAAAQGHVDACFALAEDLMVDHDFGEMPGADDLPPHPDDPISDFRKQRMINAGMAARTEAADYYRHAAARGHPRAQGRLGEMYRTGNAVPRNRVAAHMWLSRALAGMAAAADGADWPAPGRARRGEDSEREEMLADYHAFAAALAALEKAMTPAQISKAQARVSGGANKGGK